MLSWFSKQATPQRIYLDFAAATPVRSEVLKAMQPYFTEQFANPSSIHREGVATREVVEGSRQTIARTLGVRPSEVLLTGSGSESNNLALAGHIHALVETEHLSFTNIEIIATRLEHPSVTEVLNHLERLGIIVHYAPLTEEGLVDLTALESLLNERTRLVSVSYVTSELGTIQPIRQISRLLQKHNSTAKLHVDASQAPLWLPCQVPTLGADLLTLDAGKCGGPKGVGILVRRGTTGLRGVILGGGQESGLRAGTENTPGIVGAATAIALAQKEFATNSEKITTERDQLLHELLETVPGAILNGTQVERVANNINISILGLDTEYATVVLDSKGIAVSTKSACSGAGGGMSDAVYAVTKDTKRARATLRLTLSPDTILTSNDRKKITTTLSETIKKQTALVD